jgi:hypothetical protein
VPPPSVSVQVGSALRGEKSISLGKRRGRARPNRPRLRWARNPCIHLLKDLAAQSITNAQRIRKILKRMEKVTSLPKAPNLRLYLE